MGKKRNSKSVILTIVVTVIVLAVLSFIGIRFLMPHYVQQHTDVDVQYKIYRFAVRLFPLLVGIVLILIASMIASSKDEDEEDEDDLLPPNSYDSQLFENPNDDPVRRVQSKAEVQTPVKEAEPEVLSSDAISDDDFLSIYSNDEEEKAPKAAEPEKESASKESDLADAVYALVAKLDKQPATKKDKSDYAELENKVDKLCDAVSKLAELVAANASAVKVVETKPEPVKKAPAAKKAPAKKQSTKKAAAPAVAEEQRQINDFDAKDPVHLMRVEFESAQEDEYDITYAFTKKKADDVKTSLGEIADAFTVKGKTVVVIPFLTKEEAEAELNRENIKYTSVFVSGTEKANFDDVVMSKL